MQNPNKIQNDDVQLNGCIYMGKKLEENLGSMHQNWQSSKKVLKNNDFVFLNEKSFLIITI